MESIFHAVVYINLDKRPDRRAHMEKVVERFQNVHRFPAIVDADGHAGCSKSHIAVLEMALNAGWENVLVLEDDAVWSETPEGHADLRRLMSKPYDVILLGGIEMEWEPTTHRVRHSAATHAYIVNKHYIPTLLANFREGLALFQSKHESAYTLDRYWHSLVRDAWFIVIPNLFYQADGYSDISKKNEVHIHHMFGLTTIRRALWGHGGKIYDATADVRKFPSTTQKLTQSLFQHDPCIGTAKVLVIEYEDGRVQIEKERDMFKLQLEFGFAVYSK